MSTDATIGWDRELLAKFKERYALAIKNHEASFKFVVNGNDHDVMTAFAEYLIEYLEESFGR